MCEQRFLLLFWFIFSVFRSERQESLASLLKTISVAKDG